LHPAGHALLFDRHVRSLPSALDVFHREAITQRAWHPGRHRGHAGNLHCRFFLDLQIVLANDRNC